MEIIVVYGYNIIDALNEFKIKSIKEIEKLTAMNVQNIEIVVKGIEVPNKEE